MKTPLFRAFTRRLPLLAALLPGAAMAQLSNYWPVTETSGTTLSNTAGGTAGTLNGAGVTFVNDGTRGQVLDFSGAGSYVAAGTIPVLNTSNSFTWSFWSQNTQANNNNVIIGNRYSTTGATEFSPREFTKFTNQQFEYHRNAAAENVNYPDMGTGGWQHNAVVKAGNHFISYRNGLVNGLTLITASQNNAQPLFFGGNGGLESWNGRLDDIATWTSALPTASVVSLAKGTVNPSTAPLAAAPPTLTPVLSESFDNLSNWTSTNRGLENNAPSGYNAPSTTGGQLTLSGTTTTQYWYGTSVESSSFSSTLETSVSVDRVSISGSGTAYRSSLWILGDNTHYLHFSQNINEGGWTWNANDAGGVGTLSPTGGGNNIVELDSLDANTGLHNMKITLSPTGTPGEVNMFMYLNGNLVAGQGFSNFPSTFQVVLTGQGRAVNDSVSAVFDNLVVAQVPEPTTAAFGALALAAMGLRRRRRA